MISERTWVLLPAQLPAVSFLATLGKSLCVQTSVPPSVKWDWTLLCFRILSFPLRLGTWVAAPPPLHGPTWHRALDVALWCLACHWVPLTATQTPLAPGPSLQEPPEGDRDTWPGCPQRPQTGIGPCLTGVCVSTHPPRALSGGGIVRGLGSCLYGQA